MAESKSPPRTSEDKLDAMLAGFLNNLNANANKNPDDDKHSKNIQQGESQKEGKDESK